MYNFHWPLVCVAVEQVWKQIGVAMERVCMQVGKGVTNESSL